MTMHSPQIDDANSLFIYRLFHDMQAGVRAFQSLPDWIAEDLPPDALNGDVGENFDLLKTQADLLAALIEGARAYMAAPVEETAVALHLDDMVQDIWQSARPGDTRARVSGAASIVAPPALVSDVLGVLLDNVARHGATDDPVVTVGCAPGSRDVWLRVADQGPGVPEDTWDRLFEPFQTVKPRDQTGTAGLGLAKARKLLAAVEGTIAFCPPDGPTGCTVEVRLPARVAYIA